MLHALVAGEVEGLADPDARAHQLGHDLPRGLDLLRVDHGDRDDRRPGGQRHARQAARLAAVEAAVGRAGALGVDPEQLAALQHLYAALDRRLAGAARPGAVHGELADALEEGRRHPALDARGGEVLRLRDEGDLAVEHRGQEEGVRERQVVAGQNGGALGGDVLQALHPGPESELQRPSDGDLHRAVQQPSASCACWSDHIPERRGRPRRPWSVSVRSRTVKVLQSLCRLRAGRDDVPDRPRVPGKSQEQEAEGAAPDRSRAVPPRGRGDRRPPLPRLHRFAAVLAPVGAASRRARADRVAAAAARARHPLGGPGGDRLAGLVRGGGP